MKNEKEILTLCLKANFRSRQRRLSRPSVSFETCRYTSLGILHIKLTNSAYKISRSKHTTGNLIIGVLLNSFRDAELKLSFIT
jgi:hypothetical protein